MNRFRTFATSRTSVRALVVGAVVLLLLSWRLDQAVRTAYQSGWTVAPHDLDRLPSTGWVAIYVAAAILAFLLFFAAAALWQWQPGTVTTSAPWPVVLGGGAVTLALAAAGGVSRGFAGTGHAKQWVTFATLADFGALLGLAVLGLTLANESRPGGLSLVVRARRLLQRQRMNLIAVGFFTLVLTLVPQTSGQAIDSIRAWTVGTAQSTARLTFGLGSAVLLSLVLYETGLALARAKATSVDRPDSVRARWWLIAAAAVAAIGALCVGLGPFGYGLFVVAGVLFLLFLFELPRDLRKGTSNTSALNAPPVADDRAPEYLAIVPLLAVCAIALAAAIEAALSTRVAFHSLKVLLPGLVLAGVAILFTAEGRVRDPDDLPAARRATGALRRRRLVRFGAAFAGVIVVALVLEAFGSAVAAAVVGGILFALSVAYATAVFRTRIGTTLFLATPVALAAGLGVWLLVEWDVHRIANTLGVFALVNLALAFILAWLNYAVRWSLKRRPPRLLWWFGFEQLPIVSLVLLCWIGAGLIKPPASLHDVRVAAREEVRTAAGTRLPPSPTLRQAFEQWRSAQPELANGAPAGPPVPLVLVASHGGGIRASYWTALALDCVVAVTPPADFRSAKLDPNDPRTCTARRRTPAQQRVAERRIFLVSGVSGGAVGLYAYARQLLSAGDLGMRGRGWINDRLSRDFASATIAWGLFHDLPNHILGVHSHRGGGCTIKLHECVSADRAAVLEDAFDRTWDGAGGGGPDALLRHAWDLRSSADPSERTVAETVPLVITNATVVGGSTRSVVSAADLSAWPGLETSDAARGGAVDTHPVAGTTELVDALCPGNDIRLSSAAFLGARFPYVSPSGHLEGHCGLEGGEKTPQNTASGCARADASVCALDLVDGGYTDNSGLFTIDILWPSLRALVVGANSRSARQIAPVLLEIDNHYRVSSKSPPAIKGSGQTLAPITTAFGGRRALETYARAEAYRLTPDGCTVTISPALHPGLTAPLGWELSKDTRTDLTDALVRQPPGTSGQAAVQPELNLRRLQSWLGGEQPEGQRPLKDCVPK